MVSLLFISNNPKVERLRVDFQQLLKFRIEVAEDFDLGLKLVFEKRPEIVCIQDQINGVTGESVARHIQLLLGNAAPHFFLLYDGSSNVRAVPGMFNTLIDLSGTPDAVRSALDTAMSAVLGERWTTLSAIQSPPVLPPAATDSSPAPVYSPVTPIPSSHDVQVLQTAPKYAEPLVAAPTVSEQVASEPYIQEQEPTLPSKPSHELAADSDQSLDLLLESFEAAYLQRKRRIQLVLVSLLALVVAAALLFWYQRKATSPPSQTAAAVNQQGGVHTVPAPIQSAVSSAASSATSAVRAQAMQQLLSFIPQQGEDPAFSRTAPGWSRYLSEQREYRLFRESGRLLALQVIARGAHIIVPQELTQVLQEVCGNVQYQVSRQERKDGLYCDHAVVSDCAELLIYRLEPRGPIKAFVLAPSHEVSR